MKFFDFLSDVFLKLAFVEKIEKGPFWEVNFFLLKKDLLSIRKGENFMLVSKM